MTRWIPQTLGIVIAAMFFSTSARAAQNSPLYCAADEYRDAVCHFERDVIRLHYIERSDKRLVDRLEDMTSRLRSESRRAKDFDRLVCTWEEIQRLHYAVNAALFNRPCYPCNPKLEACWRRVEYAFHAYSAAFRQCALGSHRDHDHSFGPRHGQYYQERFEQPRVAPPLTPPIQPIEPIRSTRPSFDVSPYSVRPLSPSVPAWHDERVPTRQYGVDSRVESRYEPRGVSSRQIGAAIVGALLSRALN
ncbi:hypothetical protein CA13_15020 [Planctomycetes bacterium CA13]|uniref:Secreted protein n=1 Tax=Novipirellula herctigrandis TaxID=2527986 RepID=A0A5C5YYA2_9BACT|nr:hypothetical protein CA13_15020 [Planctomycetes bacterium CA13]